MTTYKITIKDFNKEKIFNAIRNGNKFFYNDNLGLGISEINLKNKKLINFKKI